MTTPAKIRVADQADEEELVRLAAAVHAEIGVFGIDFAKVRLTLREAYMPPPLLRSAIIGVIGGRGQSLQGAICLRFFQEWYSPTWEAVELFNYVYPEFRKGTTNSKDLMRWADDTATELELPLTIGVLSTHRTEAKIRHYRSVFGDPVHFGFRGGFNSEVEVA